MLARSSSGGRQTSAPSTAPWPGSASASAARGMIDGREEVQPGPRGSRAGAAGALHPLDLEGPNPGLDARGQERSGGCLSTPLLQGLAELGDAGVGIIGGRARR